MSAIIHKRSSTVSAIPVVGDLALGELALNTNDGKVYMKKDDGAESVVEIGAGGGSVGTIPFYKEDGTQDTIALVSGDTEMPFYKEDGSQDNILLVT